MDYPTYFHAMQQFGVKKQIVAAIFVALASALRLLKNIIVGPIQFVNFPAIFTIIGGLMFGYQAGALIGVTSFIVSDLLLGYAGVWTIVTAFSMGLVGILSSLLRRVNADSSMLSLGVCSYLLVLVYDILSSVALQLLTLPLEAALTLAIVGLFLPSSVTLYPVGLVTEIVTVFFIVLIYPQVKKAWNEVKS
jgi:uncharacterized membrane protein